MCNEPARSPQHYVVDGPNCNVAQSTCIKMALFSSQPFFFFFLPDSFQKFTGQSYLGRQPRNTLVEDVEISLRKGKQKPLTSDQKVGQPRLTRRLERNSPTRTPKGRGFCSLLWATIIAVAAKDVQSLCPRGCPRPGSAQTAEIKRRKSPYTYLFQSAGWCLGLNTVGP